jgi:hypothetical protein
MPVQTQFQIRRGTASQWTTSNPVLASGELGLETDTRLLKVGDGVNLWTSLAYINQLAFPIITTNGQTGTTYTLVLADAQKNVELNNSNAITLTVPLNATVAFPIGTQIQLLQTSVGQVTVSPATAGVTLNGNPGLKLRGQWSAATLIKRASDTWVLVGDTTA